MTTDVKLSFTALTIDSEDPVALGDFWGKALGHPAGPGAVAGDTGIDITGTEGGPRMIIHKPKSKSAKNSVHLVLITDHYEEEIERLTGLGARALNEVKLQAVIGAQHFAVRETTFADPQGNEFELVIWQPEGEQHE
jgi:glyoxalase superfamily protein